MIVRANCFEWMPKNIPDGCIDLVITDPPYGNIVKAKWDQAWTMEDQWELTREIGRILKPGGTAFVWGGIGKPGYRRIFYEWLSEVEVSSGLTLWDHITWGKRRAYGRPDRLLFTREEVAMLVKGDKPATFHVPLLDKKRGYAGFNKKYPAKSEFLRVTNVWSDISELFRGKIHEQEKPWELAARMISMSSNPGDLVVDMFAGSGSTGLAAEKLGLRYLLIEQSDCQMHGGLS